MFRTLPRLMFGRPGRALGVLLIIAAAWFYWWAWPEGPIRTLQISRGTMPIQYGTVAPDGKSMLISNAPAAGNNYSLYRQRVISLTNGVEVLDSASLSGASTVFSTDGHWLRVVKGDNPPQFADLHSGQWLSCTPDEAKFRYGSFTEQWSQVNFSLDGKWYVSDRHYRGDNKTIVDSVVNSLLDVFRLPKMWYEISDKTSKTLSRRIHGGEFVGFSSNDRAWTNDGTVDALLINEWDISFKRPPWWLYLLTAAGVGFIGYDYRRGRGANASAKRR